jgi:leucyl aminopeptidase
MSKATASKSKSKSASGLEYSTYAEVVVERRWQATAELPATVLFVTAEPLTLTGDLSSVPGELREAAELVVSSAVAGKALGKLGDLQTTLIGSTRQAHRVSVVSLGQVKKLTRDDLRRVGAVIYRHARQIRAGAVAVLPPKLELISEADVAEAITTGALLSAFEFRNYVGTRREKEFRDRKAVTLRLLGGSDTGAGVERGRIIAQSCNLSRTVASRPGNDINPVTLASVAQQVAKATGLKCSVMEEKEMARLGMGGLLAVGTGSATPPRLITLEHRRGNAGERPLLVVGKSITFDTGGISIKPADKMWRMIYDKSGGCAVLGFMHAIAKLNVRANVIGLLTSAENHVSDRAYRPGDIIRQYNGLTVEITSTDAEGRLVLADAISWGIEKFKPTAVVDIATLTGGCVVALGNAHAGLFSNNDALAAELTAAGAAHAEKLWRLPVGDEHREMLKSDLADVVNAGGRYASPCTAAAFLSLALPSEEEIAWAHLDVAGTADSEKDLPYMSKGSTGFGVRTILHWVENRVRGS